MSNCSLLSECPNIQVTMNDEDEDVCCNFQCNVSCNTTVQRDTRHCPDMRTFKYVGTTLWGSIFSGDRVTLLLVIHSNVDVRMRYEDMMGGPLAVFSCLMTDRGKDANYISCLRLEPTLSSLKWVSFTVITSNNGLVGVVIYDVTNDWKKRLISTCWLG